MKKTKTIKPLLALSLLALLVSCGGNDAQTSPSEPNIQQPSNPGHRPSTPNDPVEVRVDNGTEAAKILLANERLDSSVLEDSNGLFTKGKKAFSKIVNETRRYNKKYAGRENETYTEVNGDTIKWYNDVDYSNFKSFFDSYAVNIESSALRGGQLIDDTKKYIRVIDKWVNVGGYEYLLTVNETSETIYSRSSSMVEMCKRYTDESGQDVYEMFIQREDGSTRMKYIPGLVYEFTINSNGYNHYLFAENYKGYWTVNSTSDLQSYVYENTLIEYSSIQTMILKEEACYLFDTSVYSDRETSTQSVQIISSDHKTDLITITPNTFTLFNTGIKGLDYIKIEASEDKRGEFSNNHEVDRNLYVYEQNNVDDNGNKYKIYTTSGHKSATAVLENGMEFTQDDTFLNDKVRVGRIDVGYVAGCDAYGTMPFYTTAQSLDENFEIIKEFLNLTGITFRRDLQTVLDSAEFALNDVPNYGKYYKWNGYVVNDLSQVKLAINAEKEKTKALTELLDTYKDIEVIDYENQEAMNANMYFADVTLSNENEISNEGFKVNVTKTDATVTDTLLFVDKEYYKLVFALQNKDGTIIPLHSNEENSTQFVKGKEFTTSQQLVTEIPEVDEGEYVLVTYVATAQEGIRVTNPEVVKGNFTSASNIATKINETIKTNEEGNLILVVEETNDIYQSVIGEYTYADLEQILAETAYQYGQLNEELVVEEFKDNQWVLVEKPVVDEETSEGEETPEGELTDEAAPVVIIYSSGQYRLKYVISTTVDEETVVEYGYVYLTIVEPEVQ